MKLKRPNLVDGQHLLLHGLLLSRVERPHVGQVSLERDPGSLGLSQTDPELLRFSSRRFSELVVLERPISEGFELKRDFPELGLDRLELPLQ